MKLGLTGRIACGKSTVSKILSNSGFRIVDCDKIAHELLFQPEVKQAIRSFFGEQVFSEEGNVSRPALGAIVFADHIARSRLEEIMRPKIHGRVFESLMLDCPQVIDCFELIGTPIQPLLYETWVVTCGKEQQLRRLMQRNGLSEEQSWQRMNAQKPQEELIAGADVVIDNSGTPEDTERQVLRQLKRLRKA